MNSWLTGRAPIDKTTEEEGDEDDKKRREEKEAKPACFLLRINGQAAECNDKTVPPGGSVIPGARENKSKIVPEYLQN